jgi:ABC-type transport system involved in resistance to organic solvents, periplasmic component
MKRRDEVLVGITATLAILVGVVGALWLARGGLQPGYPLYAKFTWGAGLKQGQPVLLSGMTIGNVDRVILHPDGFLIVRLRIQNAYHVPLGTTATIEPNGFFGDQLVALKPSRPNMKMFAKGDTILSGRPTPQIGDVLARVDTIAGHLSTLAAALNRQMVDSGGFVEMRRTLRDASALMLDIRKVAANQDAELSKTQASLRHATSTIDSTEIDSTLRAFRSTSASLTTFMTDLRETTAKLNTTLAKLNEGNGSAAKLLNDAALYNRVSNLTAQLDSLIVDFKKNPRKYIKLSIF